MAEETEMKTVAPTAESAPDASAPEQPAEAPAANADAASEATEAAAAPAKQRGPRVPLPSSLQSIVGALLFASKNPLSANELKNCIRAVEPQDDDDAELMEIFKTCTAREVDQALKGLAKELDRAQVGFKLVCTAGTYRLQTDPTSGRYVRSLLKLARPARLGRASLETLAIVAYRQPISKSEVEQIRGVAVDSIMKTLVDLELVRIVGRSELPGHPFLYGTTQLFLEHFGLASLQQLNDLDPTLQRSNPKERAALFKKPVKEEKQAEEKPAAEEPAQPELVPAPAETPEPADAEEPRSVEDEDAAAGEEDDASKTATDDDDIYIDDTPDEFDDEDDDEDDDGDDEDDVDDDDDDEENDEEEGNETEDGDDDA